MDECVRALACVGGMVNVKSDLRNGRDDPGAERTQFFPKGADNPFPRTNPVFAPTCFDSISCEISRSTPGGLAARVEWTGELDFERTPPPSRRTKRPRPA